LMFAAFLGQGIKLAETGGKTTAEGRGRA